MNILITNDDGIREPGILALAEAAKKFGDIYVIAPNSNRSVCGHHKTLGSPMRADPYPFPGGIPAWETDGSPSDCTAMGILGFLDKEVDLVLSGINPTCNMGYDLTYSGTVTAALEAAVWRKPGIAFSYDCHQRKAVDIDFSAAKQVIRDVLTKFFESSLPANTMLNVNIPYLPYSELHGYQVTRSGSCTYNDTLVRCKDPFGRPYYWFGGDFPTRHLEEGMDSRAVADGYVSITPVHSDLTDYQTMTELSSWDWKNKSGDGKK